MPEDKVAPDTQTAKAQPQLLASETVDAADAPAQDEDPKRIIAHVRAQLQPEPADLIAAPEPPINGADAEGRLPQAIFVTAQDLAELDANLREILGATAWRAQCADGLTRRFSSVQAVLAYPNTFDTRILLLRCGCYTDRDTHGLVSIGRGDAPGPRIYYNVTSDSVETVAKATTAIRAFAREVLPSDWPIRRVNLMLALPLAYFGVGIPWALVCGSFNVGGFKIIHSGPSAEPAEAAVRGISFVLYAVVIVGLAGLAELARRRAFPDTVFAWGKEANREAWRVELGYSVLISAVVLPLLFAMCSR